MAAPNLLFPSADWQSPDDWANAQGFLEVTTSKLHAETMRWLILASAPSLRHKSLNLFDSTILRASPTSSPADPGTAPTQSLTSYN